MRPKLARLLVESEMETKENILKKVRLNDKFYRISLMLLTLMVLLGVGIGLYAQIRTLNTIKNSENNRDYQIQELNRHMDCIVKYFSENPDTRKITDIHACTISRVPISSIVNTNGLSMTSQNSTFTPSSSSYLQNPSSTYVQPSTTSPQSSQTSPQNNSNSSGGSVPVFLDPVILRVCQLQTVSLSSC